jgi:hypothetical protein
VAQRICIQFVFIRTATPQRLPNVTTIPDLAASDEDRALCARFAAQRSRSRRVTPTRPMTRAARRRGACRAKTRFRSAV